MYASTDVMNEAFSEPAAANSVVIVLINEDGLTPQDEATYRELVQKLRADTDHVMNTQDFVSIPELRTVMTSEDNKAYNLPVSLTGVMASGPGQRSYNAALDIVKEVTDGSTLTPNIVGAAATLDDVNKIGVRDQIVIETTTGILVFTILVLVYRSFVAMMLPLLTIGAALVVAQQVVAGLGLVGLGVGPQTLLLMTAMMLGAGTDYAIFLLSRYQEVMRSGVTSDEAMETALTSIGQVIAGSAFTVAAAFMGMAFTDLGCSPPSGRRWRSRSWSGSSARSPCCPPSWCWPAGATGSNPARTSPAGSGVAPGLRSSAVPASRWPAA